MEAVVERLPIGAESKKLNLFERYLSLWVGGCMVAGIILGKTLPDLVQTFRSMEFGQGSHINLPIAVLIWLMIIPMMMKVDFASVRNVGRRPKGLAVTLSGELAGEAVLDGVLRVAVLSLCVFRLGHSGRSRSIHCRVDHLGGGSLYRNGVCVELSDGRRSRLYLGPGVGQRSHHARPVRADRRISR